MATSDTARLALIAATLDAVTGRAIVIDDDLGILEVDAPGHIIVTYAGREYTAPPHTPAPDAQKEG
jgi:hypothetical protein